ncbi:MAG: hypothetical protein ACREYE_32750 [Gammaproteobacteria bacterium]
MDFKLYFYGLTPLERDAYADRAGTTVRYIQCHLISRRKIPRLKSLHKLAAASDNRVSLDDLLVYFYKADHKTRQNQF